EAEAVHLYHRTGINYEVVVGPEPQPCHDLFISEMVHYPGDIARAIEIYNPRSVPVDLTGYALRFYPNGQHTYDATLLSGVIQPGDVRVYVAPNYATNINTYADQITDLWFDGQETIVLVNGDTPIDIIGRVGDYFEDDNYWFNNGVGTFYTVLVRKPNIDRGDVDGTDPFLPDVEWIAYPVNDYSHLGSHTAPCAAVCTPTIGLSAPAGPYCAGDDITITANVTNAGTNPAYQWTVNDIPVGGSGPSYTINGLTGSALVRCTLEGDATCATASSVPSAPLLLQVAEVPAPVASITGNLVTASPVAGATYQWYLNGDVLPGGGAASVTVSVPGDYTVVATVNGCASEVSNTVTFDINTGLWMGEVPVFSVAPNPTDGPLTIRTEMAIDLVEVWNAVGQKVMEQHSPVLDLSPLTPGVYQVVVLFKGQRWQARIVRR
ncbi:MAG TPA: lamin tail domain-containing protein, partial [Flavobacteriales bacterium]|nr:lamin tail domain-containing protein [Flavobacteriales bacterium]